ncbi:helix-turn-helix domain-containing protein [Rosenbergiella epipactidis]|uniref:helix-turn-helix domain-containing protein n=1 Tax=Rosenbergiella epipactidis TaxID=1544694 RepID=UPI001F4E555B|nr:XRE family transcriptional regulator [Rosenbergiella epipactidis]
MTDLVRQPSSISGAIALKLKHYRKTQKYSLDDFSRMSGVSKGMLVEIEACRANPSIAILCKIANILKISVADLVDITDTPTVYQITADAMPLLWEGEQGGSARLLAGTPGSDMFELWQWQLSPNEHYNSPAHSAGTKELIYVQQGTLTLTIDEQEYLIERGNAVVANTDHTHRYANQHGELLIFTMAVQEPNS